jgi:hypothetical protein
MHRLALTVFKVLGAGQARGLAGATIGLTNVAVGAPESEKILGPACRGNLQQCFAHQPQLFDW